MDILSILRIGAQSLHALSEAIEAFHDIQRDLDEVKNKHPDLSVEIDKIHEKIERQHKKIQSMSDDNHTTKE